MTTQKRIARIEQGAFLLTLRKSMKVGADKTCAADCLEKLIVKPATQTKNERKRQLKIDTKLSAEAWR